jgi:hypothetical protein
LPGLHWEAAGGLVCDVESLVAEDDQQWVLKSVQPGFVDLNPQQSPF